MWLRIIERELSLASKRRALYLLRPVAPLVLLTFMVLPFLVYSFFRRQEGRSCFTALSAGIFVAAIFASLGFSADSISSERRHGTLPLLYLAGLTNFDVLLGKLSAAGIPALLALLSVFPLLAFPLLLGGVEGIEVTRLVLILLSTLWLGLAAGVWGSIRSSYQADSVRKALLLLLGLLLGGAAFATIIVFFFNRFQTRKIWPWLFALMALALLGADILFAISFRYLPGSPLYDLVRVASGPLPGIWPGAFWLSMALSFCGGLLVIASAAASRVSSEPDSEHFRSTSRTKGKRSAKAVSHFSDPLKWLILHEAGSRAALQWTVVAVMVVRLFYLFPALFSLMRWNVWVLFTLPSIAMTFLLARLTASFGAQGRETGTLEILLTTPVSWWEIVRVQKRIYIEAVRIPAGVLIGMDILMHATNNAFGPSADPLAALLYFASNTVSTVLFFMSIFWVALYFSLRSNSALHAAGKATLLVTLLPMLGSYIAPLLFRSFLFISLAPYAIMMIVSSSLHAGIYVAMILWAKKRITPPGYSTSPPRTTRSLSWVRLSWEGVRRVGEDVL